MMTHKEACKRAREEYLRLVEIESKKLQRATTRINRNSVILGWCLTLFVISILLGIGYQYWKQFTL